MHVSKPLFGTLVAVALSSTVSAAQVAVDESAQCKLTNLAEGVVLYEGDCRITEEVTGTSNTYAVFMGSAEPFIFSNSDGQGWVIGQDQVEFRDLGKGGIFKWSDFALAVAE